MISQKMIANLIELTSNVTDAFTTALYVTQADKQTLKLREHLSLSMHVNPDSQIPVGHGLIGQVAQEKQVHQEDFIHSEAPELPLYTQKENLKGFLAVPVMDHELEGVLVIDTKEQYGFSNKLQKIVTGLADQMAWHLRQEKQIASTPPAPATAFGQLIEWCKFLSEAPDRASLSDRLIQVPQQVCDVDAVAVVWFGGEEGEGRVLRFRGWEQELRQFTIIPGKGFAGSCAKNQAPFLMRDTNERRVVIFSEEEKYEPFGSLLSVPLKMDDQLHGLVVCASKKPNGLSTADLDHWLMMTAFAASALRCAEIKTQWEYDKNLCQVTGIPNHRFLSTYIKAVETEVLKEGRSVFALTAHLQNLHTVYQEHGVEIGDLFLKQIINLFSQAVTTPKYIFKYTESAVVLLLMDIDRDTALEIKTRLKHMFQFKPFTLENEPLEAKIGLGLAFYPADGRDLGSLIGVSMSRATHS